MQATQFLQADLDSDTRVVLTALEIAALLAQHKTEAISRKLYGLLALISAQPSDFRVRWSWVGTMHFVQTDDRVAPVRAWLLSFFEALQGKDRASLLRSIQDVAASFKMLQKP